MTFERWLDALIDEKELNRNHIFKIEYEGTIHLMKFKVLIESIIALPEKHQNKIKDKLVAINFRNGDYIHYFSYVAEALIKNKA